MYLNNRKCTINYNTGTSGTTAFIVYVYGPTDVNNKRCCA